MMIKLKPWWEEDPGCLHEEESALTKAGIVFQKDEEAFNQGILVLHLDFPSCNRRIKLIAVYPPQYPYFRPDVYAPDEALARHQGPIDRLLCLSGPYTEEWQPSMTLADWLLVKIPEALADQGPIALEKKDVVDPLTNQAAPISGFFSYDDGSFILVDGAWQISGGQGSLMIRARVSDAQSVLAIQGLVISVQAAKSRVQWLSSVPSEFQLNVTVPFVHIGSLPPIADKIAQLKAVSALHPQLMNPPSWQRRGKSEFSVSAVAFREEVSRDVYGTGWVFFVLERPAGGGSISRVMRVRSYRAGRRDIGARVPAVGALKNARILLVGCGAVGAPIAWELARNGVGELRLNDPDKTEPGPSIRWPLGVLHTNRMKTLALAGELQSNYLHCTIRPYFIQVGDCPPWPINAEFIRKFRGQSAKMLDGADLVIDATCQVGVQQYLSEWCFRRKIPYIYASATPGAVGGLVGRIIPCGDQGCWACLQRALHSKFDATIAPPPQDDDAHVMPPGCTHPTFAGAGYDLLEVSLQAVRMAVQCFQPGAHTALARLQFDGALSLPQWTAHDVPTFDGCRCRR